MYRTSKTSVLYTKTCHIIFLLRKLKICSYQDISHANISIFVYKMTNGK